MELDFSQKLTRMIDGTLIFKNEKKDSLACLETLEIIIRNLVNHPEDPKYKSIKEKSKSLQRVLNCNGGQDLLVLLGGLKKVHQFESHFIWESGQRIKDSDLSLALQIIGFYKTKLTEAPQESLKEKLKQKEAEKNQILKEIQFDRMERMERIERDRQRLARERALGSNLEQRGMQKTLTSEEESELLEKRQKLAGRMRLASVKQAEPQLAQADDSTESENDDDS